VVEIREPTNLSDFNIEPPQRLKNPPAEEAPLTTVIQI
jgi:hypothetical protein